MMSKINGIYAASMSVINEDLTLDVAKTIQHAETIIDQGCHGAAIFGSTGQAQLISISEKINLFNQLSISKYKERYIIGTGLNSLSETINLVSIAKSLNFKKYSPKLICVEIHNYPQSGSKAGKLETNPIYKFLRKKGYKKTWENEFSFIFRRK